VRVDEVLAGCALFETMTSQARAALGARSRIRRLQANQIAMLQGDQPTSVSVLVDGLLRVFTPSPSGIEATITVLIPGDHVGELGVATGCPRSASVAAMRPSTLVEVPAAEFLNAYRADGALARAIVDSLGVRLRSTTDHVGDLATLDLPSRVAKFLLREWRTAATPPSITLPFSQQELGTHLGGARQSINQVLAKLERDRVIAMSGRTVTVLDQVVLERRSCGR
jgi:CRP/FNR family transcriptional regulator, cyclic AMP receptor protein